MQKICVETFGCAANVAEGEMIKGVLGKTGHEIVAAKNDADIIVLNVCTVKGNTCALHAIRRTHETFPTKKIIIAGCVPHDMLPQLTALIPTASVINTHNVHRIAEAVEQTSKGIVQLLERTNEHKINLPRVRKNPVIGILPISSGCDSACTFCSVKFIKGAHVSYAPEKIVEDVKRFVDDGCKEIWLTGQDTSCYGLDIGVNLPRLLQQLVAIDGDFKIRLGMANPKHIKNYLPELIDVYRNEKMFSFLHIPVQSGNDVVLHQMKRSYTVLDFMTIVHAVRTALPHITLSTDIICGFPNETPEQFNDTVNLVKNVQFDAVNISRFIPRPGTLAAKMTAQISGAEKKRRTHAMTNAYVWTAYERNKQWQGWEGSIIIDERGKHDTFIGRNYAYKPVAVKGNFYLGQTIAVKVTDITATHLRGVLQ